jgi:hypothetical protein
MTDKTLTLNFLKQLRAAGVKSATFGPSGDVTSAEFFPRSLLDASDFAAGGDESDPLEAPTEPPPPPGADERAMAVAPAFQRVLGQRSVS